MFVVFFVLLLPILKTECIEILISVSDGLFNTYIYFVLIFSSNFKEGSGSVVDGFDSRPRGCGFELH